MAVPNQVPSESMSEADDARFTTTFTRALASDTGEEAKRHLAAGRPIYYGDDAHPNAVVKQFPDGRRQLVTFQDGKERFLRDL